ncbi:hypothetical protein [Mucilaginibacter lacusdianchii]|uniref:hypothetical protein n=1 Tax=Mucilaginibacter lacusdianchii TaxID=2684211 RepID=UPI00131BD754|nr:hypothetical protein [Mucilaginibacter sp. JXJ CY 39]
MYRKDTILTEVERLTQFLAKLLGLKNNNEHEEAQQLYEDTMRSSFGLQPNELPHLSNEDFMQLIRQKGYSAGKLDILAQLLFQDATTPLKHPAKAKSLLEKTLLIFDMLEQEHHIQSFDNIALRNKILYLLQQNA